MNTINDLIYKECSDQIKVSKKDFLKLNNTSKISLLDKSGCGFSFAYKGNAFSNYVMFIDKLVNDQESSIYLGLCVMSISLDHRKESYKKLLSELRLRNVYAFAKILEKFNNELLFLMNFITGIKNSMEDFILSGEALPVLEILTKNACTDLLSIMPDTDKVSNDKKSGSLSLSVIIEDISKVILDKDRYEIVMNKINGLEKTIISSDGLKKDVLKWDQWKDLNNMPDVEQINDHLE